MFNCDKCGACCKSIAGIELLANLDRGDGVCKYLNEVSNLCEIYNERPLLCNVEKSYEYFFSEYFTWEEFKALNYAACEKLKNKIDE